MTEQTCDYEALLHRYAAGPRELRAALAGLGEADLDLAPAAGSWSIRQITHHIVDGDDLWKMGIKAALGNGEGLFTLQWYWEKPQVVWAECWNYAGRALEPSLALFEASRQHIVQLLQQIPAAWEKTLLIRWPGERQEQITVRWVVEVQTRHVIGHIGDIQEIRQAHHL